MSTLSDFGVYHCVQVNIFSFDHTFETREFILGQIAYTLKCSSRDASMQPPVSMNFVHGPVILPYISDTFNGLTSNFLLQLMHSHYKTRSL